MAEKLIATEDLFIGRDRAHVAGDEVPAENVERNGWEGKVAPASSAASRAAIEEAEGYDPGEHTVDEVNAKLREVDPGVREGILQAEAAGKGRTGILGA